MCPRPVLVGILCLLALSAASGCPAPPTEPEKTAKPRAKKKPTPSPNAASPSASPASPEASADVTATSEQISSSPTPSPTPDPIFTGKEVKTFAGNATAAFLDATGEDARFDSPNGIDIDAAGNLFVADTGNSRIRKITPGGVVTTVAGAGPGYLEGQRATAMFRSPYGVAVGADGVLYVADTKNHRIRKIATDGFVTTLAGDGTAGFLDETGVRAKFDSPFSLTVDKDNNVLVADAGNRKIRRITPAGKVTTLAGSTQGLANGALLAAKFALPGDLALDASNRLLVVDTNNHAIRRLDLGGNEVMTLAGNGNAGNADATGSAARFNLPTGLTVDLSGIAYVADSRNHRIRVIQPDGKTTTLVGDVAGFSDGPVADALFNEPTDLAVAKAGQLYVADTKNNRIRLIK